MFLKDFFFNFFFEKSADDQKSMKNYPACIELKSDYNYVINTVVSWAHLLDEVMQKNVRNVMHG